MQFLIIIFFYLNIINFLKACPILDFSSMNVNARYIYIRKDVPFKIIFSCDKESVLIGNGVIYCLNGVWNNSFPICASKNCSTLPELFNGMWLKSSNGAVATAFCDHNFELTGSTSLICTKNGWTNSMPSCQISLRNMSTRCSFDNFDRCNWNFNDGIYEWDLISTTKIDKFSFGKYPTFDHTLGPFRDGHYLYLTSKFYNSPFPKTLGYSAKFISPLFEPTMNLTETWCLIFFTYSYGPRRGEIKVFLNNDLAWENVAFNTNIWVKVTINLNRQLHPFRITIEGIGQTEYQFSNTAIDDIKIMSGSNCEHDDDRTIQHTVEPDLQLQTFFDETTIDIYSTSSTFNTTLSQFINITNSKASNDREIYFRTVSTSNSEWNNSQGNTKLFDVEHANKFDVVPHLTTETKIMSIATTNEIMKEMVNRNNFFSFQKIIVCFVIFSLLLITLLILFFIIRRNKEKYRLSAKYKNNLLTIDKNNIILKDIDENL